MSDQVYFEWYRRRLVIKAYVDFLKWKVKWYANFMMSNEARNGMYEIAESIEVPKLYK